METLDLTRTGTWAMPAGKRHVTILARTMRKQDRAEVLASGNLTPEKAVRLSLNRSTEAYALYHSPRYLCERLLAIFGIGEDGVARFPWMLTSDVVDENFKSKLDFYRASKRIIKYFRCKHPLMMNMVYAGSKGTLKWAEQLGFTVSPPENWGASGALFSRITMVTHSPQVLLSRDELAGAKEVLGCLR